MTYFLGYCDPETKNCVKDSEGKPMCVWKDGYKSSFKTVSSAVLLLIQILFLAFWWFTEMHQIWQ